jgi:hypothetical protein
MKGGQHRHEHVAGEHQRSEVAEEDARQRRDVQPVRIGVREDAYLVIAERLDVVGGGSSDATAMSCTCEARISPASTSQVFRICRAAHHDLELAVAGLLGRAARRVALDEEQPVRCGSWLVQSPSLPQRCRSPRVCATSGSP